MITIAYGVLLAASLIVVLFMTQQDYEDIDIRYWTIMVLIPIIILGYWMKSRVTTPEAAVLSFSFIYLDSTVLLTVILFAILHFMDVHVRPWVKIIAYGAAFVHLFMIWICFDNDLYYSSITLIDTGFGTATKMEGGPLRIVHWTYLSVIMLAIVGVIVAAFVRRGTYSRRTLWLYTTMMAIGVIVYFVEAILDVDFSILPFLYVIAQIIIAHNYDHAHMHDISSIASRQLSESETIGFAAIDLEERYLGCNRKMLDFIPELANQIIDEPLNAEKRPTALFHDLVEDIRAGADASHNFESGERTLQCEATEFSVHSEGEAQGYLFTVRDVTEEQKTLLVMRDYNDTLNSEVRQKTDNIRRIQEKVVLGLADMIENRDSITGGHVKRTSDIIQFVVDEVVAQGVYDIDEQFADDIVRAAPMHDLGKITIENSILLKPDQLTDEEYEIMKTHSAKSGEFVKIILQGVEEQHFVNLAFNVARYHHERWDGLGYPDGLVGEMIPLEARIMAVADVYDALVSKRSYKNAMDFDEVADTMLAGMGTQFDPNMSAVFIACRDKLEAYYQNR